MALSDLKISMETLGNEQNNVNGASQANGNTSYRPLKVIIIGSGLGGLTAAIGLSRQGHEITLLEISEFDQKLDATVQLTPNISESKSDNALLTSPYYDRQLYQHDWLIANRPHLQRALEEALTGSRSAIPPAKLVTGKQVDQVDGEIGLVVTKDGERFQGDVLVCADGLQNASSTASQKVFSLLDTKKLHSFVYGRLALIGDAARPFLSRLGQNDGMAIEDAISLAVMLPTGINPDEAPLRLQLYETARYERSHNIQNFSPLVGEDEKDRSEDEGMQKFLFYYFTHDEYDHSSQILREHLWSQRPAYWRQPIGFGPMPGPRQNHYGIARQSDDSTFVTASIKFRTSKTVLQNLFPPGETRRCSFSFSAPGSIAYASIIQTTLNKMEWLGGSGYNHLGLYIHGVQCRKKDGTVVKGTYMPVLFENLTDPIVSGREELGFPKLYSAIDVDRRGESYFIRTSWQGAQWGNFKLTGLKEQIIGDVAVSSNAGDGSADEGILLYRYMPTVGKESKGRVAAEEYSVFVPYKDERPVPRPKRTWKADKASFEIDAMNWDALPTLHHIIDRLAEIPIYEIVSAKIVEGTGVPDVASAYRLE